MKKFFFVKKKKKFPTTALPAMFSSWHPHRIGLKHKMHDSVEYIYHRKLTHRSYNRPSGSTRDPGGGTLGISGWGCAAGTLEPLTYTRASSAESCYPILE